MTRYDFLEPRLAMLEPAFSYELGANNDFLESRWVILSKVRTDFDLT